MSDYPEHDKLHKIAHLSQACGEFVDWLEMQGIVLAVHDGRGLSVIGTSIHDLLAEHFQIDPMKLEAEKRRLLGSVRGTVMPSPTIPRRRKP